MYYLIIFLAVLAFGAIEAYLFRFHRPSLKSSSVLLTYYTNSVQLMPLLEHVLPSGAGHVKFVTKTGSKDHLIDIVYLNFTTDMRLLAIPTSTGVQLNPTLGKSMMERVTLEGDFPSYFSLFANKEDKSKAQYVLDPKAMAFVIDFCRSHSWELVNNELIFVSEEVVDFDLIEKFIREIRPAIEVPASRVDPLVRNEYKPRFMRKLPCPICRQPTKLKQSVISCPIGHGHLLTGSELVKFSKSGHIKAVEAGKDNAFTINCPNCTKPMAKVNYTKGVIIDSCISCPYRWLDTGELVQPTS